ncbi:large terminase [Rhizobium favelukesii]|uniref:Large terminase n=1 Tax=Rhizobium favelukesii TaxID=348824 RepID=W6R7Q0_9HYPH|nr:large terminase [Rhizobium favelukesii]
MTSSWFMLLKLAHADRRGPIRKTHAAAPRRPLRRHAGRASEAGRRADRGSRRRALAARVDRGRHDPLHWRTQACRRCRRSAGGGRRNPAAASSWQEWRRRRAGLWCLPIVRCRGQARPAGQARWCGLTGAFRPTAWSPRSTRAATWSPRCGRASTRGCRSRPRATRGEYLRAEPVAALHEQGRVAHAGRSPDRLDALVWTLTALTLEGNGGPRVRGI